jgi:DNA-binding MurR/RpiR family transcriptional regulator
MADNVTEQTIHEAMSRLLEGEYLFTDGRLTISNLAREAKVSRATVNRYTKIVGDFRYAVSIRKTETTKDRVVEDAGEGAVPHIVAQHAQARAMLRQQEERRASRAGVVIFPRFLVPSSGGSD